MIIFISKFFFSQIECELKHENQINILWINDIQDLFHVNYVQAFVYIMPNGKSYNILHITYIFGIIILIQKLDIKF